MIKKIATLGPQGTYSDIATQRYIDTQNEAFEVVYFTSIKRALNSVGDTCDFGVLPIENLSEGYVSLVLDHLLDADLFIIGELMLPIQFSLVSNTPNVSDIDKLFVQFVAKGQCSEFIDSLGEIEIVTTESNIESLDRVSQKAGMNAAVVPSNSFARNAFNLVVENINDYKNNQTRFLVFSSETSQSAKAISSEYKTSIIVIDDDDHPGLLGDILASFSKRDINLTSIISRPTRQTFGKYHFFIDFDGHVNDEKVADALRDICTANKVKIMGSYPKAEIVS
jgi:prephenate dehydratase